MLAITLAHAKNVAIVAVVVLVVGAVGSAWLMKSVTQKAIAIVVLGAVAFAVWSQRSSMQQCADLVRQNLSGGGVSVELAQCEFFGVTVPITDSETNLATANPERG